MKLSQGNYVRLEQGKINRQYRVYSVHEYFR